jgi:WD40-like Beta Propeller Repeat
MTMVDLRERFEAADQIAAPDLWDLVREKVATATDARSPELHVVRGAGDAGGHRRAAARKVLTIAAALLIALLAIGLLVRAFRATSEMPASRPSTGIFNPVQGWIAALDDAQQLRAVDPTGFQQSIELPAPAGSPPIMWSPDGTHLLLGDGSMVNADGTITRVLPRHPGAEGRSFSVQGGSFSPDGSEIVYSDFDGNLYVVDALPQATPRLLAAGDRDVGFAFPAWSPDGSRIAYVIHTNSTGAWGISIMRANGTGQRVLLDLSDRRVGELAFLVWSPDGSVLAFSSNPGCCDMNRDAVGVVRADGSGFQMITPPDGSSVPSWSPDGQRIAFIRGRHFFTMTPDGGDVQRVPGAEAADLRLAWNPIQPGQSPAEGGSGWSSVSS